MTEMDKIIPSGIFDFPVVPLSENLHEKGTGNNNKHILICLAGTTSTDIHAFLEKVMSAVGVDLAADALTIPVEEGVQFSFATLDHQKGFSKALFFGLRPNDAGLHLNAQKYQPLSIAGKTFLFSDTLQTIQEKPELKRPLWEGLKIMFS